MGKPHPWVLTPRANDNNNTGVALVSCDCTLSVILDILFSALASFFPCYDSQVTSQVLSQQPRALHSGQTNRIAAEEKMSEKSGSKVGQQLAVSRLPVTLQSLCIVSVMLRTLINALLLLSPVVTTKSGSVLQCCRRGLTAVPEENVFCVSDVCDLCW